MEISQVVEPSRFEPMNLESIADPNLGAKVAVGRAKQPCAGGKLGQNPNGALTCALLAGFLNQ
jgi:hypothetical protein